LKTIQQLDEHISDLERVVDPDRPSSGLAPTGRKKKTDHADIEYTARALWAT